MGQKSNLKTLQKLTTDFSILTLNKKKFIHGFNFSNYWNFLLYKKNILAVYQHMHFVENKLFLNYSFFFRSVKIKNYKKKLLKLDNLQLKAYKNKLFHKFLLNEFKLVGINVIALKITNLNRFICYKTLTFLFSSNKKFIGILFNRRLNLFLDFIKLESLFFKNCVSAKSLLIILAQIFQVLPKKIHNRFLNFLKLNFKFMTDSKKNSVLKGIKFVISGKIKGKTRSTSNSISFGEIPTQSISKNVDYSKIHVFTIYGVFGFKLWVYKL